MRRRLISLAVLLLLALSVPFGTALAQDEALPTVAPVETEAPPDAGGPVIINPDTGLTSRDLLWTAIIVVLIGAVGLVLRPAIIQLGSSVPAPVFDVASSTIDALTKSLQEMTAKTPTRLDDAVMDELKATIEALRQEILRQRE